MKKIYLGPDPILISAGKRIGQVVILSENQALMHDKPTVMVSDKPPAFAEIPSMEYIARYELPEIKKSGKEARREKRLKQRKNKKR